MLLLKRYFVLALLCGLGISAKAQQVFDIRGIVCTKGTNNRIGQASITNKKTGVVKMSDEYGVFSAKASEGDTLEITKVDFTTAVQVVSGPANMIIFMVPVTMLNQVNIRSQSKQAELAEYMDDYRKQGVYNGGKSSALGTIAHPVNALYDLFGKKPAQARRFAEFAKKEQEASDDKRKFSKALIKRITNLPDEELDKFIDSYKPTHQDLVKWTDYDLIEYIKQSYNNYKKYGAPAALQKLTTPLDRKIKE